MDNVSRVDWAARAHAILKTPPIHTDKTDERGVSSVLSVGGGHVFLESQGLPPQLQDFHTCRGCLHRLRAGTCAQPEAAGLTPAGQGFGIAWPPQGHAAGCAAFSPKAPSRGPCRPYSLSAAEGDAAHAKAWDDTSVGLFTRRTARLQRQGFRKSDAEDLAERMHLRDVQQDGRVLCLECRYLTGTTATAWRCGNHTSASVPHNLAGDLVTLLQRCPAFSTGSA